MLARLSAIRTVPRLVVVPLRHTSSKVEGSVAQSKEFSKKEAAHENEYIHRHDAELLRKLREQIKEKQAELDELQKTEDELKKKQ